jgi:dynein heavy chain
VREASDDTKTDFMQAIQDLLDALRTKIHKQDEVDQSVEAGSGARAESSLAQEPGALGSANELRLMRQIEKLDKNQSLSRDPVYEQLGFKHNLKFSARNELRDLCKKFLRFAFLLDYVALESLRNVSLHSIHDTIDTLRALAAVEVDYSLESDQNGLEGAVTGPLAAPRGDKPLPLGLTAAHREASAGSAPHSEQHSPLFAADCLFGSEPIPSSCISTSLIDPFSLPPLGKSRVRDFNPLAHLQLELDLLDSTCGEKERVDMAEPAQLENSLDSADLKLEVRKVRDIHKLWLRISPDKQALSTLLTETFRAGFDCLRHFEKWAMHADLKAYD